MQINFDKYHGAGNDFIMLDGRNDLQLTSGQIQKMCDRHFGIGSDGILVVRNAENADFRMQFFNPDGTEATFCGNGARCITKYANKLGIIKYKAVFIAKDGLHNSIIVNNLVDLQMIDVTDILKYEHYTYLNTGTHHVVKFVRNVDETVIISQAREIRYDKKFEPFGTNVNFVEIKSDRIKVRTYEKGVEDETLSCGTGIVASALAYALLNNVKESKVNVQALGGYLSVTFERCDKGFKNVHLIGPAEYVFSGTFDL